MKTRKRRKQLGTAQLTLIIINCQHVTYDAIKVVNEYIAQGRFPCKRAWSELSNVYYFFTNTRWMKGWESSEFAIRQQDTVSMVYQVIKASNVETFDPAFLGGTCPLSQEQWQNLRVTDWQIFEKVVSTTFNMAFTGLRLNAAERDEAYMYYGETKWLQPESRDFISNVHREYDPETLDREYEEFKRLAHETAQRYKKD